MEASDQTSAGTPAQGPVEPTPTDSPPVGAATGAGVPADSSGQSAPPPGQDPATPYAPPAEQSLSADELAKQHNKDELLQKADQQGVDVPKSATKAEIAQAITGEPSFEEQQAAAAAEQSPANPQTVPEQRPQTFVSDPLGGTRSDTQQREIDSQTAGSAPAMDQAAYDRANSDANKKAALDESKLPNLYPGQRVQIISGDNTGRNAYVVQPLYEDAIQAMIASAGVAESRFAQVTGYIVQTRDGRNDRLEVKPDEIRPLEYNEGWGRGTF